mmetsp:Transcript_13150/g.30309  ORF Transcript_13150/g.30309 Transcript_13150/m.30309 type:complete len:104 (-) Transcript_13150:153-464(-)
MPRCFMSAWWLPFSTTRPRETTAMRSAFRMVESRCAMVMVVFRCCAIIRSSASCTIFSETLSSADVASSSSMIDGCRMSARAIATRCFCPPERCPPRCPTSVS